MDYYINKYEEEFKNIKGGFIHVPFFTEQVINKVNTPSLTIEQITKALEISIETALTTDNDSKTIGGTTH